MFLVTRAAIPLIRKSGPGGSIINLSSIEAFRGIPMLTVYGAFKSGAIGFTQSLALELGTKGSASMQSLLKPPRAKRYSHRSGFDPKISVRLPSAIPLGRFGTPG